MQANVDQTCPSCGTGIHQSADIVAVSGVGLLREVVAEWECPNCGVGFEQEAPIDMEMVDRSGFESWVGNVQDQPTCLIVKDGAEFVQEQEKDE